MVTDAGGPSPLGDRVPPASSFASDNTAGVDPVVMDALVQANEGPALAYGDDQWTTRAEARFQDLFDAPVASLACWGGTGANVVGLASVLAPHESIVTVDSAHIVVDECGAPTRFTGSPIHAVAAVDGKLHPDAVTPYLSWLGVEHHPQPKVLSISQVTEMGTVYTVDEIAALAELAHAHDLLLHVDGARIANAVVATGTDVIAMLRDPGVDLLTFGMTKNGAMYGDIVVYLRPELAARARFARKQAGQLPSKARFVAAQVLALLDDDRWLHNARHANAMAARLADLVRDLPGIGLAAPPEANALFPVLPTDAAAALAAWSFFWPWDPTRSMWRWMTSFATDPADVDHFAAAARTILAPR